VANRQAVATQAQVKDLTCLQPKPKLDSEVFKKFIILALILAVAGSVAAGMPMHSRGAESGMMDCCKKALEHNDSPHVAAAQLCCAMNCNEPGSTSGNASLSFSQTGSEPTSLVVVALPPAGIQRQLRVHYPLANPTHSQPAYILNLALLI
jgi:hypothetical protein